MAKAIGILAAVVLHAAFLLFGGLLLPEATPTAHYQEVDLMSDDDVEQEKPPEPPPDVPPPPEQQPDATDVLAQLDQPSADATPALDAASLSALSDALMGRGGGGDGGFGSAVGFASGGRIGGTGIAGVLGKDVEAAFSMSEMDQKPTAISQPDPVYPSSMRGRRMEGVVSVIFVVDSTGKVSEARAEKANAPAFEQPAVDAVKRWRFEPGVRAGKRVPCKMRVSIRFPAQ